MVERCREIDEHSSYRGNLSMTEAHAIIKLRFDKNNNCYLIRYDKMYWLSVKNKPGNRSKYTHSTLTIIGKGNESKKYAVGGREELFDNISALLKYYQENPISDKINSIGVEVAGDACKILISHEELQQNVSESK